MLTLPPSVRIYLASTLVDMRRGHDGLSALVRNHWDVDIYGGHLFVFVGRRADRCKILFWDRGGFVLYLGGHPKPASRGHLKSGQSEG